PSDPHDVRAGQGRQPVPEAEVLAVLPRRIRQGGEPGGPARPIPLLVHPDPQRAGQLPRSGLLGPEPQGLHPAGPGGGSRAEHRAGGAGDARQRAGGREVVMSEPRDKANSLLWPAIRGWDAFWFSPMDPTSLACIRILCGVLTFYVHVCYCWDLMGYVG